MAKKKQIIAMSAAALGLLAATTSTMVAQAGTVSSLNGAGSTFDYPFFSKAFYVYGQSSQVQVNYQSVGSGAGIQQFSANLVNFGASDVPMQASDLKPAEAKGGPVVQFPITLGGVAIAYNLPSVHGQVKLTGKALTDIYLGKVKTWNSPEIVALNKGLKLPNTPIVVVHRSDGSGTSYIFTNYLSTISPTWSKQVGVGKSVNWPVGIGGKGNEAVAGSIHNTVGAIGYVELAYVLQTKMTDAALENSAGKFVSPTPASVAAAAAQKPNVSATNFSIVDQKGANSYPISGYSWGMAFKNQTNPDVATSLVNLFTWMETTGQKQAASVDYVPLPSNVDKAALAAIKTIK